MRRIKMTDVRMLVAALLVELRRGGYNNGDTGELDERTFSLAAQWDVTPEGTAYLLEHALIEVARMHANEPDEDEPEPQPYPIYRPTEKALLVGDAIWGAAAAALDKVGGTPVDPEMPRRWRHVDPQRSPGAGRPAGAVMYGIYYPCTDLCANDMGGRRTGKPTGVEWIDPEPA
jgi:hypothetical protein